MWCSTECWDCEDKKCEHYISKTELYFENQRLKDKLEQEKNKEKEIERLNNIINKAIDFLKENACIDEDIEYFCDDLRYDDCKKLLDILKGSDKE